MPTDNSIKVLPLQRPSDTTAPKRGRPRKRSYPGIPAEVFDGMTELEREHFAFFVSAIREDYHITVPSDEIALHMAALEYVNLLRVQAEQLKTGKVITAARQHPGVQLRAWLDSMAATRSKRKDEGREDAATQELLARLSS